MITQHEHTSPTPSPQRAVALISGGLDSALAAKIIIDLGIQVFGITFSLPWAYCNKDIAGEVARTIGVECKVVQLGDDYLEMLRRPRYGRGAAYNPCIDCHIYMCQKAREYMESVGATFVVTGEVLGQRPMSQLRQALRLVEEKSGLSGRLLRPLSAQLLEETIPEKEGVVERKKLLSISGRSRKVQEALAKKYGITRYIPTGGGCLLTDKHFARRLEDILTRGYRTFHETANLRWGRHFRIDDEFKIIIGRNEEENELLKRFAYHDDYAVELSDAVGPTAILKGCNPPKEIMSLAAGLVQRYSRHKDGPPLKARCWLVNDERTEYHVETARIDEQHISKMKI